MTILLILGIVLLIGIRGYEEVETRSTQSQAYWLVVFMVVFLSLTVVSAWWYKDVMLGYGPHEAASEHGGAIDSLFNMTLFFTGIVYVATHIALFWFAYKYRKREGRKAKFFSHDGKLEAIWTAVPAVVMVILVTQGLVVWNDVMPDVGPDDEYMEIEATGYQWAWDLRYPGADGLLGTRDFREIDLGSNPLGQVWSDEKNIDDFHASELVLPVNTKIRVRITSKDVLHNFYLPHFRVKMDAIPGLPTYFIFTPIKTTQEYRDGLSLYPEWQVPADPAEPKGPQKWEMFDFELACAELCGTGHWTMMKKVKIVSQEEYEVWAAEQPSYYKSNIRGTEEDPMGRLLAYEVAERSAELTYDVESAIILDDPSEVSIKLENVFFETGSATLEADSKFELDHVVKMVKEYDLSLQISGHTDNTGNTGSNVILSDARAKSVSDYLIGKGISSSQLETIGYGDVRPVDTNETAEGRQNNRRIELRITSQNI